jgi:hypothetical protein
MRSLRIDEIFVVMSQIEDAMDEVENGNFCSRKERMAQLSRNNQMLAAIVDALEIRREREDKEQLVKEEQWLASGRTLPTFSGED